MESTLKPQGDSADERPRCRRNLGHHRSALRACHQVRAANDERWRGVINGMLKIFVNMQQKLVDAVDQFKTRMEEEEGQGLTEYALILALIAIIAIGALTLLGGSVKSVLSTVANSV